MGKIPSSQRQRKREGWNHRLWDQARTCARTAWSSASTSCSRRGGVCQLLQPAPKWSSSSGEHCPAPTPWDCPTATPRFWTTHVPPHGTTPSFHEGSRTNPLPFSGPSENGCSCRKTQQPLAQHCHSGALRKKGRSKVPVNESWDKYHFPCFVVSMVAECVQMWAESTAMLPHMSSEDRRA